MSKPNYKREAEQIVAEALDAINNHGATEYSCVLLDGLGPNMLHIMREADGKLDFIIYASANQDHDSWGLRKPEEPK